ncbi:MAG: hypothetical protein BJ554DRAFT_2389 [Olpidium bornovanus]|uniref:Uncharacterized protein n=1 Tax=Olpidium bornovanus TaxID=278681 RepID=A0A8H7ZQJ7_9FUNG|nr:MAG: hypothetical protein BJ554DRAFT_2389 [Olpidium bornovanus]
MFSKADLQASSSVGPRRGRADAEFAAAVAAALATVPMGFKKAKRDAKRLAQMADAAGVGAEAAPSIAELTGKVGAKESAGGRENVATGCTMAASPGTAVGPSENERGESKAASATPSTGQRDTFFDFADGAEVDGEKRPANWGSVNSVAKGTKTDAASSPRPGGGGFVRENGEDGRARGESHSARKIELSTPKAPPTPPTPPSAASTSKPGLGPAVGDGAGEDAAARRREQTGVVAVLIHKPQKQNHHEHHKHGQGHGHQRRRGRAHEPTSRSLLQKFAAGQADDPSAIEKLFATAGSAAVAGGGLEIGEGIGGAWD